MEENSMVISISHETEKRLRERARSEGISVDAYIERLVREDEDWVELPETPVSRDDPEFTEINAAVMEGLAEAKRGEGRPVKDVFTELRAKHGISR